MTCRVTWCNGVQRSVEAKMCTRHRGAARDDVACCYATRHNLKISAQGSVTGPHKQSPCLPEVSRHSLSSDQLPDAVLAVGVTHAKTPPAHCGQPRNKRTKPTGLRDVEAKAENKNAAGVEWKSLAKKPGSRGCHRQRPLLAEDRALLHGR